LIDVEGALQEWEVYQDLTTKLLNDTDYQSIGDKRFKKKSAWRKYMRAFKLSDEVLEKEIIKDDTGKVTEASFLVKVWSPDGRSAQGWGNCSKFENRRFSKINHDIPSTAMTRAINRAVSDLIGAGEVSAEEMEGTPTKKQPKKPTRKPTPKNKSPETKEPEHVQDAEISEEIQPDTIFKDNPAGLQVCKLLTDEKKPLTTRNIRRKAVTLCDEEIITKDDKKAIYKALTGK
jgi:hypothetical protein